MNPELQQIYDSTPEDGPRSRLDPYRELILRWRRQGRTYRRICQLLADQCGVKVAAMTLHEFVKLRSRPRKAVEPEIEPVATVQPVESSSAAVSPIARKPRMSIEERIAQADAIRAQFAKPEFQPKEKPKLLFDYDPDKPLTNKPQKDK